MAAPHVTDDVPHDECGVFGIFAPGEEVSKLVYLGLFALQHRGQESTGMAVSNGYRTMVFKDMGLVSQVFNESALNSLTGYLAIGHDRYSTTGSSEWSNAQPTYRELPGDGRRKGGLSLAHNGNLTNTNELSAWLEERTGEQLLKYEMDSTNDTQLVTALLASYGNDIDAGLAEVLPRLAGAFSLVLMTEKKLWAARDRHGVRPLVLGKFGDGWVLASETCALDIIGAQFVREIAPGEIIRVDEDGVHSSTFAKPEPKGCIFEYVYLARPDSVIADRQVQMVRERIGRQLAIEHPVDADMVMATPASGVPGAIGYAKQSGIEYGTGLVKNAYIGRTFIQPTQTMRQLGIKMKLNPIPEAIKGKRLVIVDDSIVRGNTQRAIVKMLRQAGAKEVHVRISSPPVTWPCYYGIDFSNREELIAPDKTTEQIAREIGADTLGYVSLDGMAECVDLPKSQLCAACFSGNYPIQIPSHAPRACGD